MLEESSVGRIKCWKNQVLSFGMATSGQNVLSGPNDTYAIECTEGAARQGWEIRKRVWASLSRVLNHVMRE